MENSCTASSGKERAMEGEINGTALKKAVPTKTRRHSVRKPRTKGLVKKLQDQIEFYFGDANLPKDKFLQEKMKESDNGYIGVDVIASFKKMQSLTTDKSLVLKAIKSSSMLELSEDSQSLRRCHPLPEIPQAAVDSRTVYVENLPTSADHDSLRKMFSVFGNITYVSLPRYKSSGVIKGFAFIEFSSEDSAMKAVEYFKIKDSLPAHQKKRKPSEIINEVFSAEGEKEEEVDTNSRKETIHQLDKDSSTSVQKMECKEVGGGGSEDQAGDDRDMVCDVVGGVGSEDQTGDDSGMVCDTDKGKVCDGDKGKVRGERVEEVSVRSEGEVVEGEREAVRKAKRVRNQEDSDDDEDQVEGKDAPPISPPPAKRHKTNPDDEDDGLSSEVSREVVGDAMDEGGGAKEEEEEGGGGVGLKKGEHQSKKKKNRQHRKKQWALAVKDLNLRVLPKTEWVQMKEMFKGLQKEHMKQIKSEISKLPTVKSEPSSSSKGFVKNCLLRVELEQAWEELGRDNLKDFCGQFGGVAYVDMKEGETLGYVRFKTSGCVASLEESTSKLPGTTFSGVTEDDERAYFLKTQAERKQLFAKDKRKMKPRGQDQLVSKALKRRSQLPTHIKFSDSEQSDTECS